ncbi:MAG: AAA family ATPase [Planctomycetota bacterium]
MSEQLSISITIQIEQLGEQMFRTRPLGPWKIEVVAGTRKAALRQVEKKLQKAVPKALPANLFPFSLPAEKDHWVTSIELDPYERDVAWQDPVTIHLNSFRWKLETGQYFVRVPALELTLLGSLNDLDEDSVTEQARVALLRQTESTPLLQIHHRYAMRHFEYENLDVDLATSPEDDSERKKRQRKRTATLRTVATDLTRRKLAPIYELESRTRELADHLIGENPQSVLLIGPAGVGKSAMVHSLVQMRKELGLAEGKIWTTTGSRIISGMCGLGMWQQRCSKLIQECKDTSAILHLGSLFELMESGKIDGSPGVASMIRHAISRGRLTGIAECTPEQLAIIEREDPMLLRVFSRMTIEEAKASTIKKVLARSGEYYGQEFSEQSIEELYRLHSRFATYSALPATALRLMRTMLGTRQHGPNGQVEFNSRIHAKGETPVEAAEVARAFAKQSGLPRFLIDDSIALDLEKVHSSLASNVIGQSEPIKLIVNLVATLKARLVRPGRPLASLMFIGPTGVGKTEMAKSIAKLLYSDTRRMVRIDMSEYASPWSVEKLIGKPGEGDGALTSPIREQPFSVVLLDEFEKADSNVLDLLLQLLGEGRLTDSQGRLADYRNAVVIMTSNLGAESFRDSSFGFGETNGSGWREHFEREVRRYVRPEFLGRLDRIVPFEALSKECVLQIAERELGLLRQRSGLKFLDADVEFETEAIELLSEIGYEPKYGARPLRRAIEEFVTVPLANALSASERSNRIRFRVRGEQGKIKVLTEKLHVKTESEKAKEAKIVQAWQTLGTLARRSRTSGPLRELENDLERNRRLLALLEKKLKVAEGPRRISSLRQDAAEAKAHIESARKLKAQLEEVAQEVCDLHLQLMLKWYRNEPIDWPHSEQLANQQRSLLRQAVEDLMSGKIASGSVVSLLVIASDRAPLETLWKAYAEVANRNAWTCNTFLLRPHDALLDTQSPEYRKRKSEKRAPEIKPEDQPDIRLGLQAGEEFQKLCDLFRPKSEEEFLSGLSRASGFGMEFHGDGVVSWLGNEYGTTHFFDSRENSSKRRLRCKTLFSEGRISKFEIGEDWTEVSSQPDRDPIRLFHMESQKLVGPNGDGISFAKGKLHEALVQAIEKEHELALWKAIGFDGDAEIRSDSMDDLELFLMHHE